MQEKGVNDSLIALMKSPTEKPNAGGIFRPPYLRVVLPLIPYVKAQVTMMADIKCAQHRK